MDESMEMLLSPTADLRDARYRWARADEDTIAFAGRYIAGEPLDKLAADYGRSENAMLYRGQKLGLIRFRQVGKPQTRNAPEFWDNVDRSGGPDACWPWTGSRNRGGYGRFYGKVATRIVLEERLGRKIGMDPGTGRPMVAMHTCDNPSCVNPAHLVEGTYVENTRDMIDKGRGWWTRDSE